MNTYYTPTETTEEVKLLQEVDVSQLVDSLRYFINKLDSENKQVGLRWAKDFEGISDLRYEDANPHGYTQDDFVDWQPGTEHIQQLAKALDVNPKGRVRLLQVNARSCYSFHADPHPYRIHVPLITNDGSFMVVWGKLWQLKSGFAYRVRVQEEHTAVNTGSTERVHLVFDNCYK